MQSKKTILTRGQLHPRNPHQGHYDFEQLTRHCPDLVPFLRTLPSGKTSIDFSDNAAVLKLNQALLAAFYDVKFWTIPDGYLCPPIPGRADYIHYLADLMAESYDGKPNGSGIRMLDIGTGANCIYPILGAQIYGWQVIGAELDPVSFASAQHIIAANSNLKKRIRLRKQTQPQNIFKNIIKPADRFDITMCNPPFHANSDDAAAGSRRKWKNLDPKASPQPSVKLNFGGQSNELWCKGGEVSFIRNMIKESKLFADQVCWFTTLVSKSGNLNTLKHRLNQTGVKETCIIEMSQGVKISRMLAWSFMEKQERVNWHGRNTAKSSK